MLDVDAIAKLMADKKYPAAYLILTRSQNAWIDLFSGRPPGAWDRFVQELNASGKFQMIYRNDNAQIYVLANRESGAAQ